MDLSMFKEGDKVLIETVTLMEENEFTTVIQKVEEDILTVMSPISKGVVLRVPQNTRVEIMVFTGGKVYKARGLAANNFKSGHFHLTDIKIDTEVKRFERRNYYRLSMIKPIRIMKDDLEEAIEGTALDMSGGGMQIKSKEKLYSGDKIIIEIELDGEFLELDCEVVNTLEGINPNEEKYGVRFEELGEKVTDKIVSYIFSVQRDRIRKDRKVKK